MKRMALSVFVALSLTPALCAIVLKPSTVKDTERKGFFGWFNRYFYKGRDGYVRGVRHGLQDGKRFGMHVDDAARAIGCVQVHAHGIVRLARHFVDEQLRAGQ